ncbi:hypothetical protein M662_16355 [Bacillus sp. SB49]|uniref:hypothetical protein n=1 Tax=Bacillus sp. SB49 TaxID=1071080 RepID=UPI00047A885A|nr:hypothetical protein [Bacillus sp. SB49]QHT47987.1 hypothetical protein M662_16355 [Bacillus sp. SB49]
MEVDWNNLSVVIPLIVLLVTLIFNLFKERRDRNYQYRPTATLYTVNTTELNNDDTYLMYNDDIVRIDFQSKGVFLKLTNISDPPMLNVLVDVHYSNDRLTQKYQIYLIEKQKSFIIPISNTNVQNGTHDIMDKFNKIHITYRSLSGQKYFARIMSSGKITVVAKRFLFSREKILSTKSNRISEFRKS